MRFLILQHTRERAERLADRLDVPIELLLHLALRRGLESLEQAAQRLPAPPSGDEPGEEVRP